MEQYQKQMEIARKKIDETDQKIIELLVKRLALSGEVVNIKKAHKMPVYDATREKEILEKIRNNTGENGDYISAVYASILSSSRAKQHLMLASGEEIRKIQQQAECILPKTGVKVLCQGVEEAYSHQAAKLFFSNDVISFSSTWEDVFQAVEKGTADFAVVPVENSLAGAVNDVYSLILKYRFFIVGAAQITVRHCLAAKNKNTHIKKVISHPQALAQCSAFITREKLATQSFLNTAGAAQYIAKQKEESMAAICSKQAAIKYGLSILAENIQNSAHNTTRFVVISRKPYWPETAHKISLCFSAPHSPGSISGILSQFSMQNLNLTKIESRPIPEKKFEYDFYLDFTGNMHNKNTFQLICSLSDELPRFSFLGNYTEIET